MKLIEILNNAGVNVAGLGEKLNVLIAKHEDKIVKALKDNEANLPPLAVVLQVLHEEEGMDFRIQFPKDKKCSEEAKALKDEMGVKDRPFNWKKAGLITAGVVVTAGVSYGGYRYIQKRRSEKAAAAVVNA